MISSIQYSRPLASLSRRSLLGSALRGRASTSSQGSAPLELANIRRSLIIMEDTIIFSLIERSQFSLNAPVYEPGATVQQYLKDGGRQLSLLEYLLMETVRLGRGGCP